MNVSVSLIFFEQIGFLIIPIATSISTWAGVFIFLYFLKKKNYLFLKRELYYNFYKIIFSSAIMSFALKFALEKYSSYLDYSYNYKSIYLIMIVGFAGIVYLLSCYLLGILKIKKYRAK